MLIQVDNIFKTYGSGEARVEALKGVSFGIDRGEFALIKGPSGSGKSTLLTILAGLSSPTGGKVTVDEIDIYQELDSDGLAGFRSEYIGFVFQSFHLMPYLKAVENVMLPLAPLKMGAAEKRARAMEALRRVGLEEKAPYLPGQLSGGQCQRVAIARALVNEPLLIMADEPTGNLDSRTRTDIVDLFYKIRDEGQTVVMVTHEPQSVERCDRLLEVVDGKLV